MKRHEVAGPSPDAVTRFGREVAKVKARLGILEQSHAEVRRVLDSHSQSLMSLSRGGAGGAPAAPAGPASGMGGGPSGGGRATAGGPGGGDEEEPTGAPHWFGVQDPDEATDLLDGLAVWVDRVLAFYEPLAPCWPWHPGVVADLLAVRHSHEAATQPESMPDALATWHDRWRPGLSRRAKTALGRCGHDLHRDPAAPDLEYRVDRAALPELAAWWASTRGQGLAPGLTPEDAL